MNTLKVVEWRLGDNSKMNSIFLDLHSLNSLEINLSLRYRYSEYSPDVAIAATLCGINVEEAEFLFIGPLKKNAKLNRCIVPIRPSLFNAKNLKELKITDEGNYFRGNKSQSWIIHVTENLPVRHVRELIVTFEGMEELYNKQNDLPGLNTRAQVKEN